MSARTVTLIVFSLLLTSQLVMTGTASGQQDSTLPPGRVGVEVELLGAGLPAAAPGQAIGLTRLTYEAGGSLNAHTHPGASVLFVESGALTYTLIEGTATVSRASSQPATPGASMAEPLTTGTIVLNAGDSLFEDADVIHTATNQGADPAVVLIANLLAADEPVTTFLEGTPTP
jgi:quercetin dioxygenase-like cupin family protein